MGLNVDGDGKISQSGDRVFDPLAQGHHLGTDNVRMAADNAFDRAREMLPNLPSIELPKLEIPMAAKVAVVAVPVVMLGGTLAYLYLASRVLKGVASAASAAAPAVAQMGPSLLPYLPEAAPVVAAASVLQAVKSRQAPPPDAIGSLIAAARGTARAAPPVMVESAPKIVNVSTGAGRPELPRRLWVWGDEVPNRPRLLDDKGPQTATPPVQVVPPAPPPPAPRAPVSLSEIVTQARAVGKTLHSGV